MREFKNKSGSFYRYMVKDIKHLTILCLLFNGNLVFANRIAQLAKWIEYLNDPKRKTPSMYTPINPLTAPCLPTLDDAWLAGFTDAEGCFNIYLAKSKVARLRFILDQKDGQIQLGWIRDLFGFGNVRARSSTIYRFVVSDIKGQVYVCDYFRKFPLKTKKQTSFKLWLEACQLISNKQH